MLLVTFELDQKWTKGILKNAVPESSVDTGRDKGLDREETLA